MRTLVSIIMAIALGAGALSANAAWRCQSSNHRGQTWASVAEMRGEAAAMSMRSCRMNSWHGGRSCHLDFCRPSNPGYGRWHCTAVGARGGLWTGMGMSKTAAYSMAMNTCRMHSPRGCAIRACFMR